MIYLDATPIENAAAPTAQATLEAAYRAKTRPECRCVPTPQPMYIAKVNDKYIIKRMPGTGEQHAPDCVSFEAPEHLSGLAELTGTAIQESPEDGTTLLKLDFALTKRGKQAAPPPNSGASATEAVSNPKKMGLTALLHFLWHEAELTKWVPGMEGKRWWGVVRGTLRRAIVSKSAKGLALSDVVFIPDVFKPDRADDLKAERQRAFHKIAHLSETGTSVGILVAEYKSHEPSAFGSKFTFKHLPDCPFFADRDLTKRFDRIFEEKLTLAQLTDAHVITIATFCMSKAGYPALQSMGLMLVDKNFLPFEDTKEAEFITRLVAQKRRFIKQLRFNLKPDAIVASAVLNDTEQPIACFVTHTNASPEDMRATVAKIEDTGYPFWIWEGQATMPDLPRRK